MEFKMVFQDGGKEANLIVDIHAIQVIGLHIVCDEVGSSGSIITRAGGILSQTVCGNNKTDADCCILSLNGSTRGGVQLGPDSSGILKACRVNEWEYEDVKALRGYH
jgi:hypothetical protein